MDFWPSYVWLVQKKRNYVGQIYDSNFQQLEKKGVSLNS